MEKTICLFTRKTQRQHLKRRLLRIGICGLLLLFGLTAPAKAEEYYICAGDESIEEVATLTGVSPQLLSAANDLGESAAFAAGELLRIPAELVFTIKIKSGDTLYSLSERYGVSVEQLLAYNQVNAAHLRVGSSLNIPLGEEVSAISGFEQAVPAISLSVLPHDNLSYPVMGQISSPFGSRWGSFHYGLDLAADQGTTVEAAAGGIVTEADWKNDAYGYAVMIDHGHDMETLYGHCSELLVEAGQQVKPGQAIALVGSTGNSTGPHVHFEVRINGECQDPLDYLE